MSSTVRQPSFPAAQARRAFTLIELLVVVAIIAVLAAMLLPAINMVRRSARTATCISNQHQLSLGLMTFANDHESRLPSTNAGTSAGWASAQDWTNGAHPIGETSVLVEDGYLPRTAFVCPEARGHLPALDQAFYSLVGIHWGYTYAINICYGGNGPDPLDPPYGFYVDASSQRFPSPIAIAAKTVLTCDRVSFVSYTDYGLDATNTFGRISVSASHSSGTKTVASYSDGHVEVVSIQRPGAALGWPEANGDIPSAIPLGATVIPSE